MSTSNAASLLGARHKQNRPDLRKAGARADFWYPLARSRAVRRAGTARIESVS